MMKLKDLICAVVGHDPNWLDRNGRYRQRAECRRCGAWDCHTMEDELFGNGQLARARHWLDEVSAHVIRRFFTRCRDCKQPMCVFGRERGSHDDCLPF